MAKKEQTRDDKGRFTVKTKPANGKSYEDAWREQNVFIRKQDEIIKCQDYKTKKLESNIRSLQAECARLHRDAEKSKEHVAEAAASMVALMDANREFAYQNLWLVKKLPWYKRLFYRKTLRGFITRNMALHKRVLDTL